MSIEKTTFMLSNLNALLGSGLTYQQQIKDGVPLGQATTEFGMNIFNGAMRNEIARDIRHTTGSNLGYIINGMAGYGNPEANAKGTAGLLGASLFTSMMSPWNYGCGGGFYMTPMMPSVNIFGGCGCNSFMPRPYMGGASFFGGGGFWC